MTIVAEGRYHLRYHLVLCAIKVKGYRCSKLSLRLVNVAVLIGEGEGERTRAAISTYLSAK
jgi:hypothetical protein